MPAAIPRCWRICASATARSSWIAAAGATAPGTSTITLPGREFEKFEVTGGHLTIAKLQQQRVTHRDRRIGQGAGQRQTGRRASSSALPARARWSWARSRPASGKMEIAGSGTIRAQSVAIDDLKMEIAGSGRAEVGQLAARTTRLDIAGSGTVIAKGAERRSQYRDRWIGPRRFRQCRLPHRPGADRRPWRCRYRAHRASEDRDRRLRRSHPALQSQGMDTEIGGSGRIHRAGRQLKRGKKSW